MAKCASSERPVRRIPAASGWLVAGLLALQLAGCSQFLTRGEGEQLALAGQQRDERLAALENSLKDDLEAARANLSELQLNIEQTAEKLARNDANFGADVQALGTEVTQLRGLLAELQQGMSMLRENLDALAAQVARGPDPVVDPKTVPDNAADHYELATQAFKRQQYPRAEALFQLFVERHAAHANADNAQVWVGESQLRQKQPAKALAAFRVVLTKYAKSDSVDPALLGLGRAFFELRVCSDAKSALNTLLRRRPKAAIEREARALLNRVKAMSRASCVS